MITLKNNKKKIKIYDIRLYLMAMYERIGKTSRDIFDVYFFYKNNWDINEKIVESRSGMSFKDTLVKCMKMLEEMDNKHILDGLGELIS